MLAPYAAAQARATGADVEGTVVDQVGGVLVGARIDVVNLETNVARQATSDATGRYVVAALPPGRYTITVTRAGFRSQKHEDITLFLGQSLTLAFALELAPLAETVTVEVEAAPLPVNRAEMSSLITQQQISSLPINGRNFISFSVLSPGVAPDHTPQQGASMTS